ncbi:hypothetical protein ZIOFF_051153 [Zingiber officinale]|uniref:Uncharacterized protein n=1 Tax=Zingiber officinale TaxID=94328 RepID=A0A8J5KRR2_ZINOF|nr:hypothetical protein ZIOFF_051153 [Zingiber officinale]
MEFDSTRSLCTFGDAPSPLAGGKGTLGRPERYSEKLQATDLGFLYKELSDLPWLWLNVLGFVFLGYADHHKPFPWLVLAQAASLEFTISQVVASIPGTLFCVWYALKKHWLANNILGIAFCIQGIEMLSLGSFKTGAILLVGLFFYDIFWVFFTPVMVSVAKSFDAPIKLIFPTSDAERPFSMLGLGDIVIPGNLSNFKTPNIRFASEGFAAVFFIVFSNFTCLFCPGIFVALALRFDVSRGKPICYFNSAFLGYTVGLVLTIIVMNWFQAAQPALLYIVPGVIGFLAAHCLWNGEISKDADAELLEFDESKLSTEQSSVSLEQEEDTRTDREKDD